MKKKGEIYLNFLVWYLVKFSGNYTYSPTIEQSSYHKCECMQSIHKDEIAPFKMLVEVHVLNYLITVHDINDFINHTHKCIWNIFESIFTNVYSKFREYLTVSK